MRLRRLLESPGALSGAALVLAVSVALIVLGDPGEALARVGGGDTFGGGGGGGGSGGGGGDDLLFVVLFEIARLLIILTIEHPVIGIPLDILFIVVVIFILRARAKRRGTGRQGASTFEQTRPRRAARMSSAQRAGVVNQALERLREEDPNFSRPLLLDFVQLLYARAHEHRGSGELANLAPYLSPKARQALQSLPGRGTLRGVEQVVIGASRIQEVGGWGGPHRALKVEFESNYTEQRDGAQTLYARERWIFRRKAGVLSKAPHAITDLRCPSCGAAVELGPDGACPYCHNVVDRGDFHWIVASIQVIERRPRAAHELPVSGGEEVGTALPSVVQPQLAAELRALQMRDDDFSLGAFKEKVEDVFASLQKAWTEGKWDRARAFETDHLYATHRFWMDRFASTGTRNVLEDIQIRKIELVKAQRDAFYDALTVRIHASMIDYVADRQGKVLSGSKTRARSFTEYWTFIRRAGLHTDPDADPDSCPSCGAGVQVSQAGVCEYCGTKVVTGEFGWVLSAIEQDEVYGG